MPHPEALLVPVLMLLDYFLTVLGAIQRDKGYGSHFKTSHYELNPVFQSAIAQKRWFSFRHFAATLVISAVAIFLTNLTEIPEEYAELLLGYLITVFALMVGRHVSNLLIFRYVQRHPDSVNGQVTFSHHFALSLSSYQSIGISIPITLMALFSGSYFAYGGAGAVAMIFVTHSRWMSEWRKRMAKLKQLEAESSASTQTPVPPARG